MKWSFAFFRRAIWDGRSGGNDTIRSGAVFLSTKASFFFCIAIYVGRLERRFSGTQKVPAPLQNASFNVKKEQK